MDARLAVSRSQKHWLVLLVVANFLLIDVVDDDLTAQRCISPARLKRARRELR